MSETAPECPPEPRANPYLIGHEGAEAVLADACRSQRLAHAWLIRGPRGIGKATLAYRFARWLMAQDSGAAPTGPGLFGNSPGAGPADGEGLYLAPEDPVFRRVAAAGHADLKTIRIGVNEQGRPRREIVADDVRGIARFMAMTPAEGGWRVVVVDSADDMNRHAANAVLKVLEEPPRRAVILLVSHSPGRLLPTIRSRCRGLTLKALDDTTVANLIERYRPDISAEDRSDLAALAEGSIGNALDLAGEGGLDVFRDLMGVIGDLPELDNTRLHRFADRFARQDGEPAFRAAATLLRWWLGRLITTAAGHTPAAASTDAMTGIARIARRGTLERWLEVWEKVNGLLARTEAINLDRRQVMLTAVLAVRDAARS